MLPEKNHRSVVDVQQRTQKYYNEGRTQFRQSQPNAFPLETRCWKKSTCNLYRKGVWGSKRVKEPHPSESISAKMCYFYHSTGPQRGLVWDAQHTAILEHSDFERRDIGTHGSSCRQRCPCRTCLGFVSSKRSSCIPGAKQAWSIQP